MKLNSTASINASAGLILKRSSDTRLIITLLSGLIVLAAPLLFFQGLLSKALQRTEDASMALLREKILQESERIKNLMKPSFFVKETMRRAHSELLPEITPELIKLLPDSDFGKDIFAGSLPGNLQKKLADHGLSPLFITVAGPWFRKVHYWFDSKLYQQCPETGNLAAALAYKLTSITSRFYEQCYRDNKPFLRLRATLGKLLNFGYTSGQTLEFKYLNRFKESILVNDRVEEVFTDYFGRQSIFYYPYTCISRGNFHGSYLAGFLQSSINPVAILKNALKPADSSIKARISVFTKQKPGFLTSNDGLEYYDRLPTEFWNHRDFYRRFHHLGDSKEAGRYYLCLSAGTPDELLQMRNGRHLFKMASGMLFLGYLMAALHYYLFGIQLRSGIRQKLILLLAVIILIPVIATGLLTAIDLKGADRLLENHVLKKTQELIREFIEHDKENDLKHQLAMLEMKKRLEEYKGTELNPKAILTRQGENLFWLTSSVVNHSWVCESGTIIQFSGFLDPVTADANKLLDIILPKYLDNLGLLKKQGNLLSRTLTLGIFEDYVTPAREEAFLPHETALGRDISHTLDTSRASSILARTHAFGYIFAYPRVSDGDLNTHAYLREYAGNNLKWFNRFDEYCEVDLSARLRRQSETIASGWPVESRPDEEKLAIFATALELKDTGSLIFKTETGAKTWAWSFRPGMPCLFAATGRSREGGFGSLTFGLIFPLLAGYGILLIMVLSLLFAEFIVKPVRIFSEGIDRLGAEEYGLQIQPFSGDEFSLITSAFNKMSAALRQREMIKRLVSSSLVEKLESSTDTATEINYVSVIASDIRGFTAISEKSSPSEVVELLNNYFTAMEEAISPNHGVIDKYIGDAIQVVFYEKAGLASPAIRACRAAIVMRQKLFQLNLRRAEKSLFKLENGIGITTGMAVSGSIGSQTGRKDFTIIGRVTEKAASLEARTVKTTSRILICEATMKALSDEYQVIRHDDESWELIYGC